jgi:hypothetical protein
MWFKNRHHLKVSEKNRHKKELCMKKILNLLGVTAFMLVIAFTMAVCADDNNNNIGNNGSESPYLGEEPTLSGQVYEQIFDEENMTVSYKEFKDDSTVSDYKLTEKGAIRKGWFSMTLVKPNSLDNFNYFTNFYEDYDNLTVSPSTAKGYKPDFGLSIGKFHHGEVTQISGTRANYTFTQESVDYLYVDKDVTISGKGKTRTDSGTDDGIPYTDKWTTKDIKLEIKAGWNAIYTKAQGSVSMTETEGTTTLSLGNPNLKWVLYLHDEN